MKPVILVAEDEKEIAMMIQYNLESNGFEVELAEDGDQALVSVAEKRPDLILMDWMLPGRTGIEVCEALRRNEKTAGIPIIILTARGEEGDRLSGLDSGADDYMVKPFSPKELIARIKAILRRARPVFSTQVLEYEGLVVDIGSHRVSYGKKNIHMGPTEFGILVHLIENYGKVFSREALLDIVWGHDVYVETRTVDVHILRLRKALNEVHEGLGSYIQTVRSAGYMLEKPE